jgi:hypothetical protein
VVATGRTARRRCHRTSAVKRRTRLPHQRAGNRVHFLRRLPEAPPSMRRRTPDRKPGVRGAGAGRRADSRHGLLHELLSCDDTGFGVDVASSRPRLGDELAIGLTHIRPRLESLRRRGRRPPDHDSVWPQARQIAIGMPRENLGRAVLPVEHDDAVVGIRDGGEIHHGQAPRVATHGQRRYGRLQFAPRSPTR